MDAANWNNFILNHYKIHAINVYKIRQYFNACQIRETTVFNEAMLMSD